MFFEYLVTKKMGVTLHQKNMRKWENMTCIRFQSQYIWQNICGQMIAMTFTVYKYLQQLKQLLQSKEFEVHWLCYWYRNISKQCLKKAVSAVEDTPSRTQWTSMLSIGRKYFVICNGFESLHRSYFLISLCFFGANLPIS